MFRTNYFNKRRIEFLRFGGVVLIGVALACTSFLHAEEYDAKMKIRATMAGGAFKEGEPLVFQLVNGTLPPGSYQVRNWKDQVICKGEWKNGAELRIPKLPHGHYRLTTPAAEVSFAVLPDPAKRQVLRDQFLAIDTHISWTGTSNRQAGYPGERGYEFIAELVRRLGMPMLRDRITWHKTNPAPGQYDFSGYEKPLKPVVERDIEVLSVYHDAPDWTRGNRKAPKNRALPTDLSATFDYNRKLAKHYRGKIQYWEFWNEQDTEAFSKEAAWDYAANMKAAYLGFKAGDPGITVLFGPATLRNPCQFVQTSLQSDLNCYFDIFSYHCYSEEKLLEEIIRDLRNVLQKNGVPDSVPMWISEFNDFSLGRSAEAPGLCPDYKEHSYRQEIAISRMLVKKAAQFQQLGIARLFFFSLMPVSERNGTASWGLLRRDYTIKAGYTALANLTFQLGNARLLGTLGLDRGIHAFLYEQPDGSQSLLVWSDRKQSIKIPGMRKKSRGVDLFGTPLTGKGHVFAVDTHPCYFHGLAGLRPSRAALSPGKKPGALNPADMDQEIVSRIILPKNARLSFYKNSVDIPGEIVEIGVELYNFGNEVKHGKLSVSGVEVLGNLPEITLPPKSKKTLKLTTAIRPANGYRGEIVLGGTFGGKRISRLIVPFTRNSLLLKRGRFLPLSAAGRADGWRAHSSGKLQIKEIPEEKAVRFTVDYPAGVDRWVFPQYQLQLPRESLKNAAGVVFEIRLAEPGMGYIPSRVNVRGTGDAQGVRTARGFNEQWKTEVLAFPEFFDRDNARLLEIGFNPARNHFSYLIRNVRLFYLD